MTAELFQAGKEGVTPGVDFAIKCVLAGCGWLIVSSFLAVVVGKYLKGRQ